MIDLHCHSYYSDGTLSPQELLEKARINNVKCLALTDHDTMAGLALLHESAQTSFPEIKIINGIELSTLWKKHLIHIIGLNISDDQTMKGIVKRQTRARIERAQTIGNILSTLGLKDAYSKACTLAGHERVGRPHFAKLLINEGFVKDMQTAFKRYLGRGKPAYVETPWMTVAEAVEGICQAGGQAVLAHPLKYDLTRTKLHSLIEAFKEAGGIGFEVVSGEMQASEIGQMAATCKRFDLLASSGSDYHGQGISRISLGRQAQLPLNCTPIWNEWTLEQGSL